MKRCSVAYCYNHRLLSGKFFYRFPKNIKYKQKWIEFVKKNRSDWPVDDHVNVSEVICEDHFNPEDYHNYYQHQLGYSTQLRLRATAVPSLPPKNGQVPPIVLRKPRKKRCKAKPKTKGQTKSPKSQKSGKGRNSSRKKGSSSRKKKNEVHIPVNILEELLHPGDGVSVEGMFEMVCVQPEVRACPEPDETTQESASIKGEKDDISGSHCRMQQEHNYAKKCSDVCAKLKVLSPTDVNSLINTILNQDVAEYEGTCTARNDNSSSPEVKNQRNLEESTVNPGVIIKQEKSDDAQIFEPEFPTIRGKSQDENARFVNGISLDRDEVYDMTRVVKQEECEQIQGEFDSDWDHIRKERESNLGMVPHVCDRDDNVKEKKFSLEKNKLMCDIDNIKQEKIESSWDSDEYEFHPIGEDIFCAEGIKEEQTSWGKEDFVSGLEGILVKERSLGKSDRDACDAFKDEEEVSVASDGTDNIRIKKEKEKEEKNFSSKHDVVVRQESRSITKPAPQKQVCANTGDLLRTSCVTQNENCIEIPLGKLESIYVESNCSFDDYNLGKDQKEPSAREHDIERTQDIMNDQKDLDLHDRNLNEVKGSVQIDMKILPEDIEIKDWNELEDKNDEKSLNLGSECFAESKGKLGGVAQNIWQRRASTRRRKTPQKFHEYKEDLRSQAAMERTLQNKQSGSFNWASKSKKPQKEKIKHTGQICKGCSKVFNSQAALRSHQNKHPVLSCKICFKSFCNPASYRNHTLVHGVKKIFFTPELQSERTKIMNKLSEGRDYGIASRKNDVSRPQTKDSIYSSPEVNFRYLKFSSS